ncbi:CCA tRNA nucleotidyltransferase [Cognatishimia sp. F0-27]|nr:CCA tRNA nucleotidyltransferase [Cognatishimia sp. F0-27]MCC1492477.1 CCA tRNA nucleotidyltransferase [Cognatishimia sp. F0-27]
MLVRAGHRAYAVGGCVRNALLQRPVEDVDIATDATPETVIRLAKDAGLKPVPTGIDHGTITVVADGTGYEVTTFRADVQTDGRHATVRFSTSVDEDARRRDFTMNALYADFKGRLTDPLGGLDDLRARRVRFIEDPVRRIEEDYLRILRFFRFSAWYGDPGLGMDPDALAAIAGHVEGLDNLSRERVGAELIKLLAAPDPVMAVAVMERTGVLTRILPGSSARGLGPLVLAEKSLACPPDAIRRLAALGSVEPPALRLSKRQGRALDLLRRLVGADMGLPEIAWRHGAEAATDVALLRAASFESLPSADAQSLIAQGAAARFPIESRDLMPAFEGAALGAMLRRLEAQWIASGFTLTREDLLARARQG